MNLLAYIRALAARAKVKAFIPRWKRGKTYKPAELDRDAKRRAALLVLVAKRIQGLAKHYKQPYRNVGVYATDPLLVSVVEEVIKEGRRLNKIVRLSTALFAHRAWGIDTCGHPDPKNGCGECGLDLCDGCLAGGCPGCEGGK